MPGVGQHGAVSDRDSPGLRAESPVFRVLGPFDVFLHGRPLDVGGARIRTLLAVLTANAGRVTSLATMVDALWESAPPPEARRTVQTYVSRLRRPLSLVAKAMAVDDLIATHRAGYVLRLPPEVLDAARFERLVTAGRDALAT